MNSTRPGYQTTDCWLTLMTALRSCLVATGVIEPENRAVLEQNLSGIIVKTAAILGNAVVIFHYIASRVALKKGDRS